MLPPSIQLLGSWKEGGGGNGWIYRPAGRPAPKGPGWFSDAEGCFTGALVVKSCRTSKLRRARGGVKPLAAPGSRPGGRSTFNIFSFSERILYNKPLTRSIFKWKRIRP
uniref:Uncharacterized protein n=1 Tax=Morchella brunnea TaxID=1174671 RepID=A0A8K1I814_9PEZI|nr:hypothetical protein LK370_mgp029 [Morchella brunnea]UBU98601.1 hypothetical protein [Morchella brunnea]